MLTQDVLNLANDVAKTSLLMVLVLKQFLVLLWMRWFKTLLLQKVL